MPRRKAATSKMKGVPGAAGDRGKANVRSGRTSSATVGYEAQLWQMADALRGSMDAAEYKHVVLGLIFLRNISNAFEEQHGKLVADKKSGAVPEDPDEYRAQSLFWVPPEARWAHLKAQAKQATIGRLVDDAMAGIECHNPALKGVLPIDYARPALDKTRLGQLIDMISNIQVGDEAARAKDVLDGQIAHGENFHHLAPAGVACFVLANGSLSSNQSAEGKIRSWRRVRSARMLDA